jgi:flagellar motor switch protein FliG
MDLRQRGVKAYQKTAKAVVAPRTAVPVPDTEAVDVQVQRATFSQFRRSKAATAAVTPSDPTPSPPSPAVAASKDEPGLRKVAKFLILLGQDEAAKVVRHLDPEMIEPLSLEIAKIRTIDPQEAKSLLKEFGYIAAERAKKTYGGKAVAQSILEGAFGAEKSNTILHKSVPGVHTAPFAFLNDLEPPALAALLASESSSVLGVVIPFLDKKHSAAYLKTLTPAGRVGLVKRLAKMEKVSREVVQKVEEGLREKARKLGPKATEEVDGKARLAEILRHMSATKEESILQELERSRPSLGDDIRRRLFTPAQLIRIHDGDFEEFLRLKTEMQIALVWKAGDEALQEKIRRNVSSRRLLMIEAELDLLTEAPERELRQALREFLEELREAVREGRARLIEDDEEYV